MALRELSAPLSLDEDGGESIALEAPGVALVRGGEADPSAAPRGTLYVTTQRLVWLPEGGAAGVQADYPAITMHAISQEGACIYMQLAPPVQGGGDDEAAAEEEEDFEPVEEVRLVPADASELEGIFGAMCECAVLNPDPEDEDGECNSNGGMGGLLGGGEWFTGEGGTVPGELPEDAAAAAARLERMLRVEDAGEDAGGRFEDAEEEES